MLVIIWVTGAPTTDQNVSGSGDNSGACNEQADVYSDDNNDTNLWVGLAVQGATVDTTITLSGVGTTNAYCAHIIQYSGVDTTTPIDVATVTATGINGDLADPGSITPTTSGAVIVAAYGASQAIGTAWTAPSDVSNFTQTQSTNKGRVGSGDKAWTSGAFDPAALTGGNANVNNSWAAATLALRPAGAAAFALPLLVNPRGVPLAMLAR